MEKMAREQRLFIEGAVSACKLPRVVSSMPPQIRSARAVVREWERREGAKARTRAKRLMVLKSRVQYQLNFGTVKSALAALRKLQEFCK